MCVVLVALTKGFYQVCLFSVLFCIGIFSAAISSLHAQPDRLRFERIQTKSGLAHSNVYCTLQDKRGFLWIGTYDGLCRYDGTSIRIFRKKVNDSSSLPFNFVLSLYEDKRGIVWVGTVGGGLCAFNRNTERFRRYKYELPGNYTTGDMDITAITEDRLGRLWVGTRGGGVRIFERKEGRFTDIFLAGSVPDTAQTGGCRIHSESGLQGNSILTLHCGKASGTLWVGVRAGGLQRFDEASGRFVGVKFILDDPYEPKRGLKAMNYATHNYNVYALYEDQFGTAWIGSDNGWLCGLKKDASGFWAYKYDRERSDNISPTAVQAIFEDSKGTLWVGTSEGGLKIFDRKARTISVGNSPPSVVGDFTHSFTSTALLPQTLSDNNVSCIMEDRTNVLWVGTFRNGICKTDLKQRRFALYEHVPFDTNSLRQSNIRSVLEDRSGGVWIGTADSGLHKYDLARHQMNHYRIPQQHFFQKYARSISAGGRNAPLAKPYLQGNDIRTLTQDRLGNIWVGSRSDGLTRYDTLTKRFTTYLRDTLHEYGLSSSGIRSALCDRDGTLWFGTKAGGISSLKPNASSAYPRFDVFKYPMTSHYNLELNDVFALFQDRAGTIWVGTNKGLYVFNPQSRLYEMFAAPEISVVAIHEDSRGILWIGTIGAGLRSVNRNTGRHQGKNRAYWRNDGLVSETIYGITEDRHGRLWMSSNGGLMYITVEKDSLSTRDTMDIPARLRVQTFTEEDGIQSNQFTQGAYHQGVSGWMYFGGIAGLTAFHPDSVVPNPYPPSVVLTGFKRFNRVDTLQQIITEATSLRLHYTDEMISFEFAALEFSNPIRNRYKYKMEGFDKDWIDAGSLHQATYTNLSGGDYTFRVIACNNDGVWNERGVSLPIYIEPPFWRTFWFTGLYVVFFASSIASSAFWLSRRKLRARILDLERQRSIDQAKERERKRLSADLHDEIGSGLTQISMLSDVMKRQLPKDAPVRGHIETIAATAQDVVRSVGNIVWALNPENDTLGNFLAYTREYAGGYFAGTGITVRSAFPNLLADEIAECHVTATFRRNMFLVVKEALANIVKHAAESRVVKFEVEFDATLKTLHLRIADDGGGMATTEGREFGNGLKTMRRRVEDMGGEFWITSAEGQGTEVRCRVRL